MTTDTDTTNRGVDPEVMEDPAAWQDLSREEQDDILDQGLQNLKGEAGDGEWRHLTDDEQDATIDAIESSVSETEAAMQAALQETWTAHIFEDLDNVPTVPFECRELDAEEKETLFEAARLVMKVQDEVDSEADLETLDIDTGRFETLSDLDDWMADLLGSVTHDPAFDAERFRTGRGMRPNTRRLLFMEIFLRYQEEQERAIKFRTER